MRFDKMNKLEESISTNLSVGIDITAIYNWKQALVARKQFDRHSTLMSFAGI